MFSFVSFFLNLQICHKFSSTNIDFQFEMSWLDTVCDFPANLICVGAHVQCHICFIVCVCVSVCLSVCVRDGDRLNWILFLFTTASQLRLPVCVDVWCVLWLFWIGNCKLLLPECLQLRPAVGQSAVDAVPLLLLELAAEQDKARDANDEGDGPQAQRQAQVGYPERRRWMKMTWGETVVEQREALIFSLWDSIHHQVLVCKNQCGVQP